jgi:hypothetical protein
LILSFDPLSRFFVNETFWTITVDERSGLLSRLAISDYFQLQHVVLASGYKKKEFRERAERGTTYVGLTMVNNTFEDGPWLLWRGFCELTAGRVKYSHREVAKFLVEMIANRTETVAEWGDPITGEFPWHVEFRAAGATQFRVRVRKNPAGYSGGVIIEGDERIHAYVKSWHQGQSWDAMSPRDPTRETEVAARERTVKAMEALPPPVWLDDETATRVTWMGSARIGRGTQYGHFFDPREPMAYKMTRAVGLGQDFWFVHDASVLGGVRYVTRAAPDADSTVGDWARFVVWTYALNLTDTNDDNTHGHFMVDWNVFNAGGDLAVRRPDDLLPWFGNRSTYNNRLPRHITLTTDDLRAAAEELLTRVGGLNSTRDIHIVALDSTAPFLEEAGGVEWEEHPGIAWTEYAVNHYAGYCDETRESFMSHLFDEALPVWGTRARAIGILDDEMCRDQHSNDEACPHVVRERALLFCESSKTNLNKLREIFAPEVEL